MGQVTKEQPEDTKALVRADVGERDERCSGAHADRCATEAVMSRRSIRTVIAGLAVAVLAIAGCSSGSSSKSSTSNSSSSSAECKSLSDFKNSISGLTNPSTLSGGMSGIQSSVDAVKKSLDSLVSTTKSANKPQVDALKSSLTDLDTAIGNLGNGSATANLQSVGAAITKVDTSATALVTTLEAGCPSN